MPTTNGTEPFSEHDGWKIRPAINPGARLAGVYIAQASDQWVCVLMAPQIETAGVLYAPEVDDPAQRAILGAVALARQTREAQGLASL